MRLRYALRRNDEGEQLGFPESVTICVVLNCSNDVRLVHHKHNRTASMMLANAEQNLSYPSSVLREHQQGIAILNHLMLAMSALFQEEKKLH